MTLMLCETLAPAKGSYLIGNSSGSLGGWPWLVSFNDPFPSLVPQAVNSSQGAQRFTAAYERGRGRTEQTCPGDGVSQVPGSAAWENNLVDAS